jgi:hypothetical protein
MQSFLSQLCLVASEKYNKFCTESVSQPGKKVADALLFAISFVRT